MKFRKTLSALVLASAISSAAGSQSLAQTATVQSQTPVAASAPTAVPALVPYSGRAVASSGKALAGETAITFLIYKEEQGGDPLFTETQIVAIDATGNYRVQLGAANPNGLPSDLFATGEARWLEAQIAGEPAQPRVLLASVPYALKAADAATVGGFPASAFVLAGAARTSTAPGAPGTITGVIAGRGLTGGGTSGTVTLNVNTSEIPVLTANNIFTGNEAVTGTIAATSAGNFAIQGALSTAAGSAVAGKATSATGNANGVYGSSASPNGVGVFGNNLSAIGPANGVSGMTASSSGSAVSGSATSATGYTNGIYGSTASPNGTGVTGSASSASGGSGVAGLAVSANGAGVEGINNATSGGDGVTGVALASSGYSNGVYGKNVSVNGAGVQGQATSTTGYAVGVAGTTASPNGTGVSGVNTSTIGGTGPGVAGISLATSGLGIGVYGQSSSPAGGTGVNGTATSTTGSTAGVGGTSNSPQGVGVAGTNNATSGLALGMIGQTNSSSDGAQAVNGSANATSGNTTGVFGSSASPSGVGVHGDVTAPTGQGVFGSNEATSGTGAGVYGTTKSPDGIGVSGVNNSLSGPAIGVIGVSASSSDGATGVNGSATGSSGNAYGVLGSSLSPQGYGVFGFSPNIAISGVSKTCTSSGCTIEPGIAGAFVTGVGGVVLQGVREASDFSTTQVFYVDASGNGYFAGNLNVTGNVSKGGGSFKIDDPLDPANKYLSHSFVESPDMMNVYNGNVTTDKSGRATVELPEYFESLNRDFRYQLTVVGKFAQAIVATEIGHNRFVIRTSKPSVKVSWQVTGIRKDAYANANRIPTEEEKPASERGYYLHPELFNQPASKGIVAAHPSEALSGSVAQLNGVARP
jgi:trimeric autotransporter adhesin